MTRDPVSVLRDVARDYTAAVGDKHDVDAVDEAIAQVEALVKAAKRAQELVRLPTIRQVIEAGDDAITAAGLNPYCMAEGRAEGDEHIGPQWWLEHSLTPFTPGQEGGGNG